MVRSRTCIATPPGATIKEQLGYRGMSQKEFAIRMDMSEKHISKLINGDVQLTQDMALRLEMVLGINASFWNNLESIYREKLARVEAENSIEADIVMAKKFPYNEMAKWEWVPKTRDDREIVVYLRKFFEIVSLTLLDSYNLFPSVCQSFDASTIAWVQRAHMLAREIDTNSININKLKKKISTIKNMINMDASEFCPQLKSLLAECGIALVFLPYIKGTNMQSMSFVDGKKIVLALSVTGKGANAFWTNLFYELGRIILGDVVNVEDINDTNNLQTDEWVRDNLIPKVQYEIFVRKHEYSERSIRMFADMLEIDPGIIVSILQKEGRIKNSTLNELKKTYDIAI